jgi:hypothetical protein
MLPSGTPTARGRSIGAIRRFPAGLFGAGVARSSTNSGPSTGSGGAPSGTDSSSGRGGCTGSGTRFEGHLHRMDRNRRADFDRRLFLLHLNPHDSARMEHDGKNKCCDDCPFARRFVHCCGRRNTWPLGSVSRWWPQYPDNPSVRRYPRSLQCCSLHMSI